MKMTVMEIDESFQAPPEALSFGRNGWIVGGQETIVLRTNSSLQHFIHAFCREQIGLLGEGELVFAVVPGKNAKTGTPILVYEPPVRTASVDHVGLVFFLPEA